MGGPRCRPSRRNGAGVGHASAAAGWVLGLALTLAGCSAGGPMEPMAPLAPATLLPEAVEGQDGTRLALTAWRPEGTPRAAILAVHGFGSYGPLTFEAAARHWAGQGILVLAYDQRGFGRNASHLRWPGPETLIADLAAVNAALRAVEPCLPLTVLGHSMGGGVVLAAAGEGRLEAEGLILAAPAIWGGERLNPVHRLAAWFGALVAPEKRFTGKGIVRIRPSDNVPYMRKLGADPLHISPPSAREFLGLVRLMDRAVAAAPETPLPAVMLIGARDEIVPEESVAQVFERLPGPAEIRRFADGWHLLFNDLGAGAVWAEVAEIALAQPLPATCGG